MPVPRWVQGRAPASLVSVGSPTLLHRWSQAGGQIWPLLDHQRRGRGGGQIWPLPDPTPLRQWSQFGGSPATRSPRASAPSVLTALSSPTRPVVVGAPGEIPSWLRAGQQWRHLLCRIPRWRLCRSAPLPAGLMVTVDAGNRQGNPMAGIALVLSTSVTPTGATPLLGGGVDFSSHPSAVADCSSTKPVRSFSFPRCRFWCKAGISCGFPL